MSDKFLFKTKTIDNQEYVLVQDLKLLKFEYDSAIEAHCRSLTAEEISLARKNILLQEEMDKMLEIIRFYADYKNWHGTTICNSDRRRIKEENYTRRGGRRAANLIDKG